MSDEGLLGGLPRFEDTCAAFAAAASSGGIVAVVRAGGPHFVVAPTREVLTRLESEHKGEIFERENVMLTEGQLRAQEVMTSMARKGAMFHGKTLHSTIASAEKERAKTSTGAFVMAFNHLRHLRLFAAKDRGAKPRPTTEEEKPSEFEKERFDRNVVAVNGGGAYKAVYGFAIFRDAAEWQPFEAQLAPEEHLWFERVQEDSRVRPYFDGDGWACTFPEGMTIEAYEEAFFRLVFKHCRAVAWEWWGTEISWREHCRPSRSHTPPRKGSCHLVIVRLASLSVGDAGKLAAEVKRRAAAEDAFVSGTIDESVYVERGQNFRLPGHAKATTPSRRLMPLTDFEDPHVRDFWITADSGDPLREAPPAVREHHKPTPALPPRPATHKRLRDGGEDHANTVWNALPAEATAAVEAWLHGAAGPYASAPVADVATCDDSPGTARVRFVGSEHCHILGRPHQSKNQAYLIITRGGSVTCWEDCWEREWWSDTLLPPPSSKALMGALWPGSRPAAGDDSFKVLVKDLLSFPLTEHGNNHKVIRFQAVTVDDGGNKVPPLPPPDARGRRVIERFEVRPREGAGAQCILCGQAHPSAGAGRLATTLVGKVYSEEDGAAFVLVCMVGRSPNLCRRESTVNAAAALTFTERVLRDAEPVVGEAKRSLSALSGCAGLFIPEGVPVRRLKVADGTGVAAYVVDRGPGHRFTLVVAEGVSRRVWWRPSKLPGLVYEFLDPARWRGGGGDPVPVVLLA